MGGLRKQVTILFSNSFPNSYCNLLCKILKKEKDLTIKFKKRINMFKIQNNNLIMFFMLWFLVAAIAAVLLIKGQLLLSVGIAPIGYYISKITIKLLEK